MGWENSLSWAEYCCAFRPIFDERHHLNTKGPPPPPRLPSKSETKQKREREEWEVEGQFYRYACSLFHEKCNTLGGKMRCDEWAFQQHTFSEQACPIFTTCSSLESEDSSRKSRTSVQVVSVIIFMKIIIFMKLDFVKLHLIKGAVSPIFRWTGKNTFVSISMELLTLFIKKQRYCKLTPTAQQLIPYPFNQKPAFKRFQHLPNIRSTKIERMLGKCWMNGVFKRFQSHSTISRTTKMLNRCWLKV